MKRFLDDEMRGSKGQRVHLLFRLIKKPAPPRNTRHLSSKKSTVAVAVVVIQASAAAAAHLTLLLIPPLLRSLARSLACLNERAEFVLGDEGATVGIIPNYRRTDLRPRRPTNRGPIQFKTD